MFPSILADVTSGSADGTGGCGVLLLPNLLHPFGEYGTYLPPLFPGESSPDGPSLGSIAGRSSPILTDFSDFLGRLLVIVEFYYMQSNPRLSANLLIIWVRLHVSWSLDFYILTCCYSNMHASYNNTMEEHRE